MTLEVAAFGWHATIFLGWGTLVVCLILTAASVLSVKYILDRRLISTDRSQRPPEEEYAPTMQSSMRPMSITKGVLLTVSLTAAFGTLSCARPAGPMRAARGDGRRGACEQR